MVRVRFRLVINYFGEKLIIFPLSTSININPKYNELGYIAILASEFSNEREILYKILFDMKKDLNELKKVIGKIKDENPDFNISNFESKQKKYSEKIVEESKPENNLIQFESSKNTNTINDKYDFAEEIHEEETLSIQDKELELIMKSLERNNGRRKAAANELGISERTLYRKIKYYDIKL